MMTMEERDEVYRRALAACRPKAPPPKPPAKVVAQQRWAEKPTEVVIRDAAVHNEAVAERLRQEREQQIAEARRAEYQAQLDRHWQSMLDAQREQREFRMVGGLWEGPNPGDYSPIARFEREWRR